MHIRPTNNSLKDSFIPTRNQQSTRNHTQHGTPSSALHVPRISLLQLPSESLTHITSFLDPATLLALGRANKQLYEHVKDDNTWHRAFLWEFLAIRPETDLTDVNCITLRKAEATWKREFVSRYNLRRRWQLCRATNVAHIPHYATISDIHLMSDDALLSSSIQYGIVARSTPSIGKIVKGFLNATGSLHGVGVGNPNAEFTPNVTACALASESAAARIVWGFRDGSISVGWHMRTMSGGRAATRLEKSKVEEEHQGAVNDVVWTKDGKACVSAGADGKVKVWNVRRFGCAWTSEKAVTGLATDPCVKVLEDLDNGLVVVGLQSGKVIVYIGFDASTFDTPGAVPPQIKEVHIVPPTLRTPPSQVHGGPSADKPEISFLFLDVQPSGRISILTAYQDEATFYRHKIDTLTGQVERITFGDTNFGSISAIKPFYSSSSNEASFVLVGDRLGCISVYDWDGNPVFSPEPSPFPTVSSAPSAGDWTVPATRRMEAFADAYVTSISVSTTNVILIAGSSRGHIKVFDTLTLKPVRSFAPVAPENVSKILVGKDQFVASVGSKIVAWKGVGPLSGGARNGWKGKSKAKSRSSGVGTGGGMAKWQQQYEIRQDIAEGAEDIGEESLEIKRSLDRAKEQASTLSTLGLSEREAVEYVLMLSRDEQWRQEDILSASGDRPGQSTDVGTEEGIFDVDMDEGLSVGTGLVNRQSPTSSPPFGATSSRSPPIRPLTRPVSGTPSSISSSYGRKLPLVVPSLSNGKIQISPRFQPEPMEAGGLSPTPLTLDSSSTSSTMPVPVPRTQDFPPVSTPGSISSGILTPTRKSSASASSSVGGVGGRNAWSSPLTSRTNSAIGTPSSSPGVSRTSSVAGSFPQQGGVSWARRLSMSPVVAPVASVGSPASRAAAASAVGGSAGGAETDSDVRLIEEEEDEELRFVLELSLAEERSRAAAAAAAAGA